MTVRVELHLLLTLSYLLRFCYGSYLLTGGRLADFPPPDESKHVPVTNSRSFYEVPHNCGKIPFHVNVYAYSTTEGDNRGYRFDATGSCQNDGQDTEGYGGILFAYNEKNVRLWMPSPYGSDNSGRVIFIGEGWGGNTHSQSSTLANVNVVVEIWKDGPFPSFEKKVSFYTMSKVRRTLGHPLEMLPEIISVRVTSVNKAAGQNYHFHATGSSQTSKKTLNDKTKKYGGIIFGYNHKEVVLWGPNKKNGGCIAVGKRWGDGKESDLMFAHNCTIHVRMWVTSFALPVYQSEWTLYHANQHTESFIEIKHNLRKYPSLVKVQYRRPSINQTYYVFEGTASVQSTPLSSKSYGGVIYAYNKEKIRLWLPTSSKLGQAYTIYVGDGWAASEYKSESAEVRVSVYADKCLGGGEIVDAQGNCRVGTETQITEVMGEWSKCSNPCGIGKKTRPVKECKGKGLQSVIRCSFEDDFCNFTQQGFKWVRSKGNRDNKKIPFDGHPPGSWFVYAESWTSKEDYATGFLTSPLIDHGEKCILRFHYNSMSYFGYLNINIQNGTGHWIENVWRMKDSEPMSGLWRKGYINVGDKIKGRILKFAFVQELEAHDEGCPYQCNPISITNIQLDCEKPDSLRLSSEQCKQKEIAMAGCFINVFRPYHKGVAWSVRRLRNIRNKPIGKFVVSNGKEGDVIATYRVKILKTGYYNLWMDTYAANNYTNDVNVTIDRQDTYISTTIFNRIWSMWLPVSRLYRLTVGDFKITLYQKELGFKYRNMMVAPKHIEVWGSLGMQNRLIADNAFSSVSQSPIHTLLYSRLNSPAAWLPSDMTNGHYFLKITLPDVAMINKVAIQGGHSLGSVEAEDACFTTKFKIMFSLDGTSFQWYRNDTLKDEHVFNNPGSRKTIHQVVYHELAYVLIARAVRFYPTDYDIMKCLRVELYGYFISNSMCPTVTTKLKEATCFGDGDCGSVNKECVKSKVSNTSSCACVRGYHGDSCQFTGCQRNPCKNGGKCSVVPNSFYCDCPEGYTGKYCDTPCSLGTYGRNCDKKCKCIGFCDSKTGSCMCKTGYIGSNCDQPCPEGLFGSGCAEKCSCNSYFSCNHVTGACSCAPGFFGDRCEKPCEKGFYGPDCQNKCLCQNDAVCSAVNGSCACKPGWYNNECSLQCPVGFYGQGCMLSCGLPPNATTVKCDPVNGHITCVAGFRGYHCEKPCDSGWYGEECKSKCDCFKANTEECDRIKGRCICKAGYQGKNCEKECEENTWGLECKNKCLCQNGAKCDPVSGSCTCVMGYQGDKCESICQKGRFGDGCSKKCSCHAEHTDTCQHTNGVCSCKPGYHGKKCEERCPEDRWGRNCLEKCQCLNDAVCDHMTGFCDCLAGFQGQYCEETCDDDTYGLSCRKKCQCQNNAVCNSVSGFCQCQDGYHGQYCEKQCEAGYYGNYCQEQCKCDTENSEQCDFVKGTCFCLPGYTGEFCTKECPDSFWGKDCNEVCTPCLHSNGPCDKRYGNCSCSIGFIGDKCENDCPFDRYGDRCQQDCSCGPLDDQICNNINGDCYSVANHSVTIMLLVNADSLARRKYFRESLEILLSQCYFKFELDLKQYPNRNITDFLKCKADPNEERGVFIVRVVDIKPAYTYDGDDLSIVTITVQNETDAILGSFLRDLFVYMGKANIDNTVDLEYYTGKTYGKPDSPGREGIIKWILIGLSVLIVVFAIAVIIRCTKKIPQPSPFQKIKRHSKDSVELQSCLQGGPQAHLLAFENPYYDVIAAMGLDDDIEEDYLNPLYEMPSDSETEPDDIYFAYRNNRPSYGNQFSFDKDSGFSSGTLM